MNDIWYDYFLEILLSKYPNKTQLVQALMDLLCIEREATYRRLRKEVFFSFHEIIKIASAWDISLDEISGAQSKKIFFQMYLLNFLDPSQQELNYMRSRRQALDHFETSSDSEYMEVCNRLPRSLTTGYDYLYRFDIFKWAYQYHDERIKIPFSLTVIPDEVRHEMSIYNNLIKHVTNTHIIWDEMIFEYLIRSILYFHSILLITDEEKKLIKQDIISLLNYMSDIADKGYYPETQNKIDLYISELNVDTNYSYLYSDELKICRIHTFGNCDINAFAPEMIDNFKKWMHMKKRTSIKISEVNEKSRIDFFSKQQDIVSNL